MGYKNEDGTVAIDKINAGGEGTTEVWRGTGSSDIVTRNAQCYSVENAVCRGPEKTAEKVKYELGGFDRFPFKAILGKETLRIL